MSARVEWVKANETFVNVDPDFADAFGTRVAAGQIGLRIGGAVIEGTREDVLELLFTAIRTVAATPDRAVMASVFEEGVAEGHAATDYSMEDGATYLDTWANPYDSGDDILKASR